MDQAQIQPVDVAVPSPEHRRLERMTALIQYSLQILASVGSRETLRQTVQAAAHLTNAEIAWLALERPLTRTLSYHMVYPHRDIPLPSPDEYPAKPISALLWGDEADSAGFALEARAAKQEVQHPMEGPIYAILAVPLRYGSYTVGVLEVINKAEKRGFTREDREILSVLAKFATNAINNAQVVEEMMHLFEDSLLLRTEKIHQEEIALLRARFTQQLAHELRNQMGIVKMAIKHYQMHPERVAETMRTIEACNYLEAMLLADVLDQAQIDSGEFSLRRQLLDLRFFFASLQPIYTTLAQDADKTLHWDLSPSLPQVQADPNRLSQIMTNLISNAIRYTRADGRITVRATPDPDGARRVRIAVIDNGPGIPLDQQVRIFQRGFRGQPDLAGGEGLGLYFVRYLVHQHNGEIGFTSHPGEGAEFYFTLPAPTDG